MNDKENLIKIAQEAIGNNDPNDYILKPELHVEEFKDRQKPTPWV